MATSLIAGGLALGILILVMSLVTRGREPRLRRAGSDGGSGWASDGGGDGCDSGSSDGGCGDGGGGDGGGD